MLALQLTANITQSDGKKIDFINKSPHIEQTFPSSNQASALLPPINLAQQATPLPLSQPTQIGVSMMPTITPYVPRVALAQPTLGPFGVPMVQPSQTGSLRQPRQRARRGPTNQEPTTIRHRRLFMKVMMVLFPRDVSQNCFYSLFKPCV